MNERVPRLRQLLSGQGIDAILISNPQNRRYLSGFTGSAGFLFISSAHAYLATDFRYWEQSKIQAPDFELIKMTGDMKSWLSPLIENGPGKLGFEAHDATYALHEQLKSVARKLKQELRPKLVPTADLVESLRIYKDADEMEMLKRSIAIADQAMVEMSEQLEPGMTERQIAWQLECSMREQGAEGTSFDIIVGAGQNAARPHHRPSDTKIQANQPIVIDMGAKVKGYCSDITRTHYIGTPDDTYKRVYDLVLVAQETAISALQAGMSGHEADKLARDVIEAGGYGDKFGHGTGHGVGLNIHENPRVSRNMQDELQDGMVFTIEPGIYLPEWGGVRIEDIVVLKDGKALDLTKAPKMDVVAA